MKVSRRAGSLAVLALAANLLTGCGGISGSKSVSPASILLPGLIRNTAPKPAPAEASKAPEVAAVHSSANL